MHTQWTSAAVAIALALGSVSPALASHTSDTFQDVPEGSFYEEAVKSFLAKDFLDGTQTRFRPNDNALRSEMIKLLVELQGGVRRGVPARPSFDDVPSGTWYFEYFEEAGDRGWVRGDRNCFGHHPCTARPNHTILRAEAAALIVRVFGLFSTGDAPRFSDVPANQWYTEFMQTAADHCVLQGDPGTRRVRPLAQINRAEMITMLNRAYEDMEYDGDCDDETIIDRVSSVEIRSSRVLRVRFSTDINESSAENRNNYTVTARGFALDLNAAVLLDDDTVELSLDDDLRNGDDVRLSVFVTTKQGHSLRDTYVFIVSGVSDREPATVHIERITVLSDRRIRVEFSADLDEDEAEDARNYDITGDSDVEDTDVIEARLIDSDRVELTLDENLRDRDYRLHVDLFTEGGRSFRDSDTFRGIDDGFSGDGDLTVETHTRGIDATITPSNRRPVFGLEFHASCDDDVEIEAIVVRHRGSGNSSGNSGTRPGLEGLRIVHKGNNASPRISVDPFDDDTVTLLRFFSPLIIDACDEEAITIEADFETSGSGDTEHRFSIESRADIDATTDNIDGSFPVRSLLIEVER